MNRESLKGIIVGAIAPVAAFVVYVAFFTDNPDPVFIYKKLISLGKLTHVISLSVLVNLLIFFMNIKTHRDQQAKGILYATILYAIVVLIIKFL
tara:strand:+ start:109 stop:390 length:282 start_codon:yes stop_codon:yes gene_type:complete